MSENAKDQTAAIEAELARLDKEVRLEMARSACLLMAGDRKLSPRDAVLDVYQVYKDILTLC